MKRATRILLILLCVAAVPTVIGLGFELVMFYDYTRPRPDMNHMNQYIVPQRPTMKQRVVYATDTFHQVDVLTNYGSIICITLLGLLFALCVFARPSKS